MGIRHTLLPKKEVDVSKKLRFRISLTKVFFCKLMKFEKWTKKLCKKSNRLLNCQTSVHSVYAKKQKTHSWISFFRRSLLFHFWILFTFHNEIIKQYGYSYMQISFNWFIKFGNPFQCYLTGRYQQIIAVIQCNFCIYKGLVLFSLIISNSLLQFFAYKENNQNNSIIITLLKWSKSTNHY